MKKFSKPNENSNKQITTNNAYTYLASNVTIEDLVQLFGLGTTSFLQRTCSVKLTTQEKNDKSKNFAIVNVPEHVHSEILRLNGIEFYGQQVVIEEAKTKPDDENENSMIKEDSSCTFNELMSNEKLDEGIIIVETVVQPKEIEKVKSVSSMEIKIESFTINKKENLKKKLRNIERNNEFTAKDNGKQYVVLLNTITYQILVDNIMNFSNQLNVKIKKENNDRSGANIQQQFVLSIRCGNEDKVNVITVTCFHTTNTVMIQILGKRKDDDWQRKVETLEKFMKDQFEQLILLIESRSDFQEMKEIITKCIQEELWVLENKKVYEIKEVINKLKFSGEDSFPQVK